MELVRNSTILMVEVDVECLVVTGFEREEVAILGFVSAKILTLHVISVCQPRHTDLPRPPSLRVSEQIARSTQLSSHTRSAV